MGKKSRKFFDVLALVLLIIGGLNWGLAVFNINLVTLILSSVPYAVNTVYSLVGLSALWVLIELAREKLVK